MKFATNSVGYNEFSYVSLLSILNCFEQKKTMGLVTKYYDCYSHTLHNI